jgi:restriction system protein
VFLWWRNFRDRRGSARGDSVRSAALGEPGALWALSYLGRYGAAERPNRGTSRITDAGRQLLTENADGVTVQQLRALAAEPNLNPAATEPQESGFDPVTDPTATALDPEEQVGARHHHDPRERRDRSPAPPARQRAGLIRTGSRRPAGGDGYGGTDTAATRTQLTNDAGIDGIIDQDALGLSRVYVRAKHYALDSSVGRPEIQVFVGVLHGVQANQCVLTTGRFSSGAEYFFD